MTTYPRGAGYETKFMVSGERYVNTHKTKEEGEAWELEQRSRIKRGLPVLTGADDASSSKAHKIRTLEDLVEHVHKVRWAMRNAGHAAKKNADLFRDWAGPKANLGDTLTTEKIEEYMLHRRALGNSPATLNRHLSTISTLISSAVALKAPNVSPVMIPWQKEGKGRLRFYSPEEETMILGTLIQWGQTAWADFFIFLMDTGARLEEAETFGRKDPVTGKARDKLQWRDIRGNAITFEDTKTGTPRTIYATPRVMEVLKRMKARDDTPHGPFEWVSRRRLRTIWDELRAEHKWMGRDTVIHTFRHSCASRLVQAGVDLYRVMRWMGHTDINTTMRYAKLRPIDMEQLTGVLANYGQGDKPCTSSSITSANQEGLTL